jgi:hypothetical protein
LQLVRDYPKEQRDDWRQEPLRDLRKLDPKIHGAESHR